MTIEQLLAVVRSRLRRVAPWEFADERARGALVVDIRAADQRARDGELPGALVIDRNVLEWRLAPSSPDRIVDLTNDQRVILVCNEGYSSTLAADTLRRLGLEGATDLIGGFQAWLEISARSDG